ncbi:rCG59039 [Rattus norvegicus]|uniref:RCG59039 n=1 Tax=Rattus norvegicus TaxID=10116 RepID=A6JPJ4_RAT|nr:rCG59039 [Rattus norvegicus]
MEKSISQCFKIRHFRAKLTPAVEVRRWGRKS